jgi:AraC-like DNA-binding protein
MAGKSLTPEQLAQAISLRAAGYTVTAISERLGVSVRTLNRVFERNGTTKGAISRELLDIARRDLIAAITSRDDIREQAARLLADDLAHVALVRRRMAEAAEHLRATNLEEAAVVMRAAAAHSTAIKNGSDLWRHVLRIERVLDTHEADELPELVVIEIGDEQAAAMRGDVVEFDVPALAQPHQTATATQEAVEARNGEVSEPDNVT